MRYAFLIAMVLHTGAAVACQTQSDAQADESSTTVMQRDCTDQVVPDITPRKELPAIPSVGVKVNPEPNPQSVTPLAPPAADPKPKVVPMPAKPRAPHGHKAVVKRLRVRQAREPQQRPMFWWHIRK